MTGLLGYKPTGRLHVLIIEDDLRWEPLWAEILKVINKNANYTWATSENEAEKYIDRMIAKNDMYDVVISDVFVSGSKTGIDLLEKYKDILSGRLIFVSGVDMNRLKELVGTQNKTIQFLKKPFTESQCLQLLKSVVGSRPFYRSPNAV